jgi:hypothetical protein
VAILEIEPTRREGLRRIRIGNLLPLLLVGERTERAELVAPALADGLGQIALVVAEIQKRLPRAVFLAHEQHRNLWRQQQDRETGTEPLRRRQLRQPFAECAIADLIVVLQEVDECNRR